MPVGAMYCNSVGSRKRAGDVVGDGLTKIDWLVVVGRGTSDVIREEPTHERTVTARKPARPERPA